MFLNYIRNLFYHENRKKEPQEEPNQQKQTEENKENQISKEKVVLMNKYIYSISSWFGIGDELSYKGERVKIIDIDIKHYRQYFNDGFYFRYLVEFIEGGNSEKERKWISERDLLDCNKVG